jgi:NAD(P)-dependent dehydrogenase (short-subunit alcohol dehydrogenase family)
MSGRLSGKVALITGAASGIGAATARRFTAEGASVVIADIQEDKGRALAQELAQKMGNATFIRCDVTEEGQVAAAIDLAVRHFGRLDCCINNAGLVGAVGTIRETSEDDWNATMAVLLRSVFFGMKHASRVMVPQGSGSILSLASVAGVAGGLGPHAYTAAKHGVIGLTESVASELAPLGIRVNAVAPGNVVTPLIVGMRGSEEAAIASSIARSPRGEPILPHDIAAGLLYLASDDAVNITGHTLVIDGGLTGGGFGAVYHSQPTGYVGGAKSETKGMAG